MENLNITWSDVLHFATFVIIPVIIKYYAEKIGRYKEQLDTKLEKLEIIQHDYNNLLDRIQILENSVKKNYDAINQHFDNFRDAGVIVLRDRLSQSMRYFIKEGCCNLLVKKQIMDMYEIYKKYGGNGFIEELYYKFLQVPLIEDADVKPYIYTYTGGNAESCS